MRHRSHLLERLRLVNRSDLEFDAGIDVLIDVKIGDSALHDFPQSHLVSLPSWSIRMVVLLVARLACVASLLLSVAVVLRRL